MVVGGLGSIIAEQMAEQGVGKKLTRMGLRDTFSHGASKQYLLKEHGMDALSLVREAEKSPEKFWARMAKQHVSWFSPWKKTLEWKPPYAKWFVGAKTNVSYNCLDRHLEGENAWRRNKAAILWVGEDGEEHAYTYARLYREVNRFANALKDLGVGVGDRVIVYMPLVPEGIVTMLACARIGAIHSVVYAGMGKEALRSRIVDAGAKVVVCSDYTYRRGKLFMNVELTNYATPFDGLVDKVALQVKKHGLEKRVIFSSFFPTNLIRASQLLPEVPRGQLVLPGKGGGWQRLWGRLIDVQAIHPYTSDVTADSVVHAHRHQRLVHVWTVNTPGDMKRLCDLGVDGFFTDDQQVAREVLDRP